VGSRPSSRHQPIESTIRRTSRVRLCSALSVSHALDGFLLDQPCASISLRCRVQGSRSRGCLPRLSRDGSRHPLPSRRWRRRLLVSQRQRTSRRPQGLAPNRGPQCPAGLLGPRVTRVPSCVFNSCGHWPEDLGSAVALPPLATFTARDCVSPASLVLSVSSISVLRPLSQEALPVRAF
jgi:hypothetical protein